MALDISQQQIELKIQILAVQKNTVNGAVMTSSKVRHKQISLYHLVYQYDHTCFYSLDDDNYYDYADNRRLDFENYASESVPYYQTFHQGEEGKQGI